MKVSPRYTRIAKGLTAGVVTLTIPQVTFLNRMALAIALAGHVRNMWIKEMQREEEDRNRVGGSSSGGSTGRDMGAQAPLIGLLVGLLPEKTRFSLWAALRDRYSHNDDGVPVAPI